VFDSSYSFQSRGSGAAQLTVFAGTAIDCELHLPGITAIGGGNQCCLAAFTTAFAGSANIECRGRTIDVEVTLPAYRTTLAQRRLEDHRVAPINKVASIEFSDESMLGKASRILGAGEIQLRWIKHIDH
jgi:hypothetical protein